MVANKTDDLMVEDFEKRLGIKLQPVQPDPTFVKHLGRRLVKPSYVVIEETDHASILIILVLAAGFLFGTFAAWFYIRSR